MAYSAACPFEVSSPVMRQRWERLAFLHWAFDPADVQRLLPPWLTVEQFDGRAWVGLVPFFIRVGTGGGRTVPWASNFCEINVRTYVHDGEGRSGIWFFSLDAARLGAVVVARTTYRLPYFWSAMSLSVDGAGASYHCVRRWPGPAAATHLRVAVGQPYDPAELTDFDNFLTARWILFSSAGRGGLRRRFARAAHPPWPLRRASAVSVDDGLLRAAGLPLVDPGVEPVVHYSDSVDVRIGMPERCSG